MKIHCIVQKEQVQGFQKGYPFQYVGQLNICSLNTGYFNEGKSTRMSDIHVWVRNDCPVSN